MLSLRKGILSMIFIGTITIASPLFADELSDLRASFANTLSQLIQKYELRIQKLETDTTNLKKEIAQLRWSGTITGIGSGANVTINIVGDTSALVSTGNIAIFNTKSTPYNDIIQKANANIATILTESNVSSGATIGLFEFIEPNIVFLSLDDGKNPLWVTAFKTKILYLFDTNGVFTKLGLFDLDLVSQKYRTVFGTNPYTKSARIRVENPNYKGKLLETVTKDTTVTVNQSSSPENTGKEITLTDIKTAYSKTKLLDAIKLSDSYIIKNPNDIEVLRIRYRSYYIIGKYDNSLAEIKKIESLQGANFDRTVACDGAVIGKITKKTDISAYYSTICKKK